MCASKAIVCLDEFSCLRGKNLDSFKSNITKRNISMRIPYAEWDCILARTMRGSVPRAMRFISSMMTRTAVSSSGASRRSRVPSTSPSITRASTPQAVALAREVIEKRRRGEPCDWVYWFTKEENEEIQRHNLYFRVNNYIAERINKFYRVPMPIHRPSSASLLRRVM